MVFIKVDSTVPVSSGVIEAYWSDHNIVYAAAHLTYCSCRQKNPLENNFVHFALHLAMWNVQKRVVVYRSWVATHLKWFRVWRNHKILWTARCFWNYIPFPFDRPSLLWNVLYCSMYARQMYFTLLQQNQSRFTWPIKGEMCLSRQPSQVKWNLGWVSTLP